uniref:Retrotransposon gag domain-containing protein n=1 Tax=Cannabis sativa TaxID=3483 RepID=A0A803P9V6_CANSA
MPIQRVEGSIVGNHENPARGTVHDLRYDLNHKRDLDCQNIPPTIQPNNADKYVPNRILRDPHVTQVGQQTRGSLFPPEINAFDLLPKFNMPTWKMYTGKEDPLSNFKYFEMHVALQAVKGVVWCMIFLATLVEAAQQWYFKLAPRKFNSWNSFMEKFHAHFSSSMKLPYRLKDMVEVKQIPGEPLRAYTSKFMTKTTKVKGLTEEGRLATILGGIEHIRELWKEIKRVTVRLMVKFMDHGFIRLEEAVQRVHTIG